MPNKKKVKIVIGYPPIDQNKGTPLLSQNRQFQYFNRPTYIYPMVPAYAATNLQNAGYKVYWMDGIAEKLSFQTWLAKIKRITPDYLMIETKTPIIKTHWEQINKIKKAIPTIKIILVGDHVTYLPYESFKNSKVSYIISGGYYDFTIVNLLNHIHKNEKLKGGIYFRGKNKQIYNSGKTFFNFDLDSLPFIDRKLTKWKLYAFKNGNYKYTPGTYMYSGRDCWWGKCTFCIWNHTLNPLGSYKTFTPERLFGEIKYVVDKYKVKEIFDDAGTFFIGSRLKRFCELMIESGYNKKIKIGCNMRFNALKQKEYNLMKKAGFRLILYGLESANQKTLNRLKKGLKRKDITFGAKMASKAGLEVHATIMLGYPWETYNDAKKTIEFARNCFKMGIFSSLQATILIPYPGTPLYDECKKNNWLITKNYNRYDMKGPVMKISYSEDKLKSLVKEVYSSFLTPQFILRKISQIRNIKDLVYYLNAAIYYSSHLIDFRKSNKKEL